LATLARTGPLGAAPPWAARWLNRRSTCASWPLTAYRSALVRARSDLIAVRSRVESSGACARAADARARSI